MTPETLKEVTPELKHPDIPPCDIRYVTVGCYRLNSGEKFWTTDYHRNLEQALRETEHYLPGTIRVFEIPEAT